MLAELAFALDEHGSPIDYARRRALFSGPASVTLDLDAYPAATAAWLERMLRPARGGAALVPAAPAHGEHPAIPGARKPFSWHCTSFRFDAPRPLRVFLRQQAEANLARHGTTGPVT